MPIRPKNLAPIDAEPGTPLYHTVQKAVRTAIDGGTYGPGDQLPSTKELARQLSVSLVTVHRALQELVSSGVLRRGQGRGTFVHEDYRDRAGTSTGLRFGLVFHSESSLADYYHGQVLEGVRQGADELGVDMVLLRFGEDWRNECQGYLYVNPFRDQLERSPRFGAKRGARTISSSAAPPVMVVGANFDLEGVSAVDTDNRDMARQAVHHLVGLGHTRIGYIGGLNHVSNDLDRRRGFSEALAQYGLEENPKWIVAGPGWRLEEDRRSALAELFARPDRPTAVFAAGYYFALDTYAAAEAAGVRIPEQLSVVGVDDAPSAAHLSPPLTTLRQPLAELGRLAAVGLFDQVGGSHPAVRRTTLLAELITRRSSAAIGVLHT